MNIQRTLVIVLVVILQFFIPKFLVIAGDNDYMITRNLASDNNIFAVNLFNNINNSQKNIFLSPYSISIALAMTYSGAKGNTEKQMADVLNYKLSQKELHEAFSILEKKLSQSSSDGNELKITNAIWKEKSFIFLASFLDVIKTNYGPVFFDVDFKNSYNKVRLEINGWVESKTNNKIKDLISSGILNSLTRMVLVNAIYFKGKWANQFKVSMTKNDKFWLNKDNFNMVPLMSIKDDLKYWSCNGIQMVELPYAGHKLSMIIILPDNIESKDNLQYDVIKTWDNENQVRQVQLFLPKFKVESGFNLNDVLSKMGMPDAFDDNSDFSGMNGKRDLYISAILHKAFVDVSEEGTEAAAATAVAVGFRSMAPEKPKPVTMRVDHPFTFVIRHNESGSIIFMGKVNNPIK